MIMSQHGQQSEKISSSLAFFGPVGSDGGSWSSRLRVATTCGSGAVEPFDSKYSLASAGVQRSMCSSIGSASA